MGNSVGKVTLKTLAMQAGVSIGTVHRALNNREDINPGTRDKVLRIAEKLKYQPNKLAGTLARKKKLHIGIAYPELNREFNAAIDKGVTDAQDELLDYGVTVEKIRYELQNPDAAFEKLNSIDYSQFDGLAFNSVGKAIEELINTITNSGKPVITFNTDFPNSARLFYIGSDPRQSGMMSAEMLAILIGYTGKVAVLDSFSGLMPSIERFSGFCEFIQEHYPNIRIHPCAHSYKEKDAMAKRLIELVELIPDISGVFCTGYASTVGALEAFSKLNRPDIQIVGYDVTKRTAQALRENHLQALIFQDPYKQGYTAAKMLSRHLLEGYIPEKPHLYIENRIVLKSNLDVYIKDRLRTA
ncbi:MAG: LacI family DNA-binding transcriptional regulator [Oscillospiraceae bacterium]|nr:LacI family DNA-binding transcriptional regulator [Oscillospiraceae bacterium]